MVETQINNMASKAVIGAPGFWSYTSNMFALEVCVQALTRIDFARPPEHLLHTPLPILSCPNWCRAC